jgi:o-succinylbenzoate synthase
MHIDSIELFRLSIPLTFPLRTPPATIEKLETVLVRVESEGLSGWGEASPGNSPVFTEEWAAGAFAVLRDWLAPAVAGQNVDSGDELQRLLSRYRGNRFAKAGLDFAWWDLEARRQGQPLAKLLGGELEAVEVGPTFDQMETIDELLSAMARCEAAGFQRVGLKFRPGWDVQMVNFVRQEFPILPIHIDCEAGLRLEHMEMLCRLDDFSLSMIEQPLPADDLVGHAMVQETVRTPICLDESVNTPEQADMALELHSGKWLKIDPGRVGGLTPAKAIADKCRESSIPCWVGMPLVSAVGQRHYLALASKPNFTYPADYFPGNVLAGDLAERLEPEMDAEGKQKIVLGVDPGIGMEPGTGLLQQYTVESVKL